MVALARRGVAILAVLAAILAPTLLFYRPVQPDLAWRESVFGTVTKYLGPYVRTAPQVAVRLVAIDREALEKLGPWPWSQERLSALLAAVQAQRPRLLLVEIEPEVHAAQPSGSAGVVFDARLTGQLGLAADALAHPSAAPGRFPLLVSDGNTIEPSLALSDALSLTGANAARIDGLAAHGRWSLREPGIERLVPSSPKPSAWATASDGSLRLLPPGAPTGFAELSAAEVMSGNAAAAGLKGAIVILRRLDAIGPATPAWRSGQALSQLINAVTPTRPPWALGAEALAAALAAGLVSLLMIAGHARAALWAAGLSILAFLAGAGALFIFKLELFEPAAPSLFAIGALAVSGAGLAVRRWLGADAAMPARRDAPAIAISGIEQREVTALCVQIRAMADLTAHYRDRPAALVRLIGKVLGTAGDIVRAHHGTLEQIGPDGLVALFNAPAADQRHAEKAAEAALAVLSRLDPINEALEKALGGAGSGFAPVQLSVGIDTGEAMLGDLGFKARRSFSAFGPALDGARALAQLASTYGPAILIGEETKALVERHFAALELDMRDVPAAAPQSFFALLGNPVVRANPRFKALQEGFAAFHGAYRKGNWAQASQLLAQCAKLPGVSTRVIDLYEQRLRTLKERARAIDENGAVNSAAE